MKYIDLSNLSHKGKFIDWINSIGTILPFQFNDIIGELQIINYNNSFVTFIDNDKYKYNLAQTNHISNYIIINAMYSELDYIKNNIINSNFSQLYNLYHIDWLKCHNDAHNSLIDVAVRLWNKGYEITKISKLMHLHRFTISRYLKQGAVLHLCDYIPKVGGVIKSKRHIASN